MRLLILGLVAIASTLAGSFAVRTWANSKKTPPRADEYATLEVIKLEPVSVPIVRNGRVEGYIIARASVSAEDSEVKKSRPLLVVYASEAVFRAVYEDEVFDFSAPKPAQFPLLAERISKLANEKLGRAIIKQSRVESLDFVKPSEEGARQTR